ncbi:hypothetical protein RAA17_24040 [Komagataeibacter rhaeticus]|nr:hypothetical protein [Komagataeibacter rhaeticus]
MAGSPEAAALASVQPGGVMPDLVMGNAAALAGRWDSALANYQNAPDDPIMTLVRPLLRGWALQGRGGRMKRWPPWNRCVRIVRWEYYTVHAALIARMGASR